jgi:hypothetical protein
VTLLGEQIGRAEHFDAPRHDSRIVNIAVAVLAYAPAGVPGDAVEAQLQTI